MDFREYLRGIKGHRTQAMSDVRPLLIILRRTAGRRVSELRTLEFHVPGDVSLGNHCSSSITSRVEPEAGTHVRVVGGGLHPLDSPLGKVLASIEVDLEGPRQGSYLVVTEGLELVVRGSITRECL